MGCHRSLLHPRFWEASSSREEADRHREGVHGAEQLVFHVRLSGRPEPHPSPATQKDLGCKYPPHCTMILVQFSNYILIVAVGRPIDLEKDTRGPGEAL